jgi:hypothetical protein
MPHSATAPTTAPTTAPRGNDDTRLNADESPPTIVVADAVCVLLLLLLLLLACIVVVVVVIAAVVVVVNASSGCTSSGSGAVMFVRLTHGSSSVASHVATGADVFVIAHVPRITPKRRSLANVCAIDEHSTSIMVALVTRNTSPPCTGGHGVGIGVGAGVGIIVVALFILVVCVVDIVVVVADVVVVVVGDVDVDSVLVDVVVGSSGNRPTLLAHAHTDVMVTLAA